MAEYTRREQYLAVIAGGTGPVPDPDTREEYFLAIIAGENVPLPEPPYTRYETYLAKLAGADVTVPEPVTQLEIFLYAACGYDVVLPDPLTREEALWHDIASGMPHEGEVIIDNGAAGETVTTCSVAFDVTQAGTGTAAPDNIRPITGWNHVTVYRSGKNGTEKVSYPATWETGTGAIAAGELNMLTGILTVTHIFLELDGTVNWSSSGSVNQYWYIDLSNSSTREVVNDSAICSHLLDNSAIAGVNKEVGFRVFFSATNKNRLLMRPGADIATDTDSFTAWIAEQASAGTPVQVAYELLTPESVQVDPQNVTMVDGENRFWTEGGIGTLTVTYTA